MSAQQKAALESAVATFVFTLAGFVLASGFEYTKPAITAAVVTAARTAYQAWSKRNTSYGRGSH